jgi:hypothetical protein
MKRHTSVIVGLLALGSANIGIVQAQPPENTALAPATPKAQVDVQRAEAEAVVMGFATETLRSKSPADYARLPVALRGAMPYWLRFQPFEAWSPELQQFAKENFQKLAADTQVERSAYRAKNKAAVVQWLQEKAPFENTQLCFFLTVLIPFNGRDLQGRPVSELNQVVSMDDLSTPTPRIIALGHFLKSLSPQQKSALFANNMHLSMAELTPEQKQDVNEIQKDRVDVNIDTPNGQISMYQSPKSETILDFQFAVLARRNIAGKEDYFEVQIARPYDYLRR